MISDYVNNSTNCIQDTYTFLHITSHYFNFFSVFHHTRAVRRRHLPSLRDGSLLLVKPKCRGPPVERCPPEALLSSGGRLRHRDCGRGGRGAEEKRARVQEQRQPHSRGLLGVYSYQVKVEVLSCSDKYHSDLTIYCKTYF